MELYLENAEELGLIDAGADRPLNLSRPSADFNLFKRDISPGFILGDEQSEGDIMTEDPPKKHRDRPSLDEIVRALREIMPDLTLRYSVKHLGVFGSYVRGEADTESDLDILVEFEQAPTLWELIRLERELGDKLGVKVDLVMKKTLKPGIEEAILKEVVAV